MTPQQRKQYEVELTDGRKFVVESDTPPTEQDVLAALGQQTSAPETPEQAEPSLIDRALADNPYMPGWMRGMSMIGRFIKDKPVAAAATAGALAAVPLTGGASIPAGLAAAGLGGAGGAGAAIAGRQLITGRPEAARDTLTTMAKEGAANAAGEGVGRGIVGAANVIVPKVLKGILRPKPTVQAEFPDVVQTMREQRIPIGQSAEAGRRMNLSADKADDMVAQAQQAGTSPVTPREIVPAFRPVRDEVARRMKNANPNAPAQMREVGQRARDLKAQGPVDLVENQALKRQAQKDANRAYRAEEKHGVQVTTTSQLDKAVAAGRQRAAEARVPGIKEVNAETQKLIGLERALEDAQARSGPGMGMNPIHWFGDAVPNVASRATFLADAAAQGQQASLARLLRQALLSQLAGEDQP